MARTRNTQMGLLGEEEKKLAEEQIKEVQNEVDFDVKDFTIDYIVDRFQGGHFYIPDYQRRYIWREKNRTQFIESVLLGLPIPFMFVAEVDDGRLEVVDGAQRIQTLEAFVNGDIHLRYLSRLDRLNGFRFSDLSASQQRKFKNRALRMIVLEESTSSSIRHEIFERINTSGERARPSEVRRGAHPGPFMDFVDECARNSLLKKLCPLSKGMEDRREYEEFVLRFFAYSDRYKRFRHDVEEFLNKYVADKRGEFDRSGMKAEFDNMLNFVSRYFPSGFAKTPDARSTPRVRFEAISVGVNLALRAKPDLVPSSMVWLDGDEFKEHTTTHASNSQPRLAGRVEYVRDQLLR